jgi:hypothetical protein
VDNLRNTREVPWLSWWMTAVPADRRHLDRLVAADGSVCELCPTWPQPTEVEAVEDERQRERLAMRLDDPNRREFERQPRWLFDARRGEFELTSAGQGGTVARRKVPCRC